MTIVKVTKETEFFFNTNRWLQEILNEIKSHVKYLNPRYLNQAKKRQWKKEASAKYPKFRSLPNDIRAQAEFIRKQKVWPNFSHTIQDIDMMRFMKEFDDIVSRLTSNTNWYEMVINDGMTKDTEKDVGDKNVARMFRVELYALTLIKTINFPSFVLYKLVGSNVDITDGIIRYTFPDGYQLDITTYKGFTERLHEIYPGMKEKPSETLEIVMTYYTQRSQSGSNWSPSLSYPNLAKYYDSGKWKIIECFCGIMNNQDLIHGREVTHARLCLDQEKVVRCTGDTKFKGTWRKNEMEVIKEIADENDNILLLVNPVYSEDEILRTASHLDTIFRKLPSKVIRDNSDAVKFDKEFVPGREIRSLLTLPYWDDLYNSDEFKSRMKNTAIYNMQAISGDMIFNKSEDDSKRSISFTFYTLEIERKSQ